MKRTALQTEDYEKAEHIIYNDLSTDVLYPISKTVVYFNQEVVERIVEQGERWCKLETKCGKMLAYTSYGRLINTKTIRVLKPNITRLNVLHYFSANRIKSIEVFKEQGWEHNILELADRYHEKGWPTISNHYNQL